MTIDLPPDPDVPLFVGDGFCTDVAWEIAIGVVRPEPTMAQEYAASAWLPGPFRAPTDQERRRFTTTTPPAAGHGMVGVVPLDPAACAALRAYHEDARRGELDEGRGRDALKHILIDAARRLVIDGSVETRQPTTDTPRQLTVSRSDARTGRSLRVGLHVDHWTASAIGDRLQAANRLSINLGPGERWLLYVPFSVPLLMTTVPEVDPSATRELLARLAVDVPVIRLLVPPAHAYVAPAEAIFHDASTFGASLPATKQSLLGRFRPRRVATD